MQKTIEALFISLPDRGLVTVSGADAADLLQKLVSNDIRLLDRHPMIRACLLTPQGKFLHDFFITRNGNEYLLYCEGGTRAHDLAKRLTIYKLRAAVEISVQDKITIYATDTIRSTTRPEGREITFEEWDTARILRGEPDGSRDAEIASSTLAELNLDESAVSYTKGCYIGQELVARMHNRNLGKKHLVPARFRATPPPYGSELENTGIMRSSCDKVGLILMNRERETELKEQQNDDSEIYLLGL